VSPEDDDTGETGACARSYGVLMTRFREQFDEIVAEYLALDGVDIGPMFGTMGVRVRGKVFAFPVSRGIIAKLPEERVSELEAGGRAERMIMRERAMREWIFVPDEAADLWPTVIDEAFTFVDDITP